MLVVVAALEALADFRFTGVETLCAVRGETGVGVVGVLTPDDIDRYAHGVPAASPQSPVSGFPSATHRAADP